MPMSDTTSAQSRTRDELVAALTEIAQADDDRWVDVVMEVVDELAHRDAADAYNGSENLPGETDTDAYDRLHNAANQIRVRLHNSDPADVADWLIERLGGPDGVFAELELTD